MGRTMFHEYSNAPLCSTFLSSPSVGQQQQAFLGGCHDEQQAWSAFPHDDDSGLPSSKFPSRLSPLPANHKRPLSRGGPGSDGSISPRQPPPTRRLPKHPPRKAPPVSEHAKAFLRVWYSKNRRDPRLGDADKKALAQLTELPEEQVVQWVKIARAQSAVTNSHPDSAVDCTASSPFFSEPRSRCSSFGVRPSQLVGGAIPETPGGYFTPSTRFPPRFGGRASTPQHVAGLHSPEMQRYSVSNSSAGGSSTMCDNLPNGSSKHNSTASFYSNDDGSGLQLVGSTQPPASAYLTPSDDLNMTSQCHVQDTQNNSVPTVTESPPPTVLDRPYKCTYGCGGDSQNKSDWKRHEETHEPQKEYICLLNTSGWVVTPDDPSTIECQFCTKRFPASSQPQMESHLSATHLVSRCLSTPVSHRTPFKRPDHLHQHLKTHHPSPRSTHWKTWNRPTATRKSGWGCGFCGAFLRTWAERVDHVGDHFKRGGIGFGEWDIGKVIGGLVTGVEGVRDRWSTLVEGEGDEGWQWDGQDTRVAALRDKLENASSHDPDALALEVRSLATRMLSPNTNNMLSPNTNNMLSPKTTNMLSPNTNLLATPSSTSSSGQTPNSIRFMNPFGFSPPRTPDTPPDPPDGSSCQDFDDVLTYYKDNPYDTDANTNRNNSTNSGLHPLITTSLVCPSPQSSSISSSSSSPYVFSQADGHLMPGTMAGGGYHIGNGNHRLSLMIPASGMHLNVVDEGGGMSAIPQSAIPRGNAVGGANRMWGMDIDLLDEGGGISAVPRSALLRSGVPRSSLPRSALQRATLPRSAVPLSARPLSAVPLSARPLSAVPLSAMPLSAVPLSVAPLSAIPQSAIPRDDGLGNDVWGGIV